MKSERAVRRALKRWERVEYWYSNSGYEVATKKSAWLDCLAWILDYGPDPTLKGDARHAPLHKE